jgi:hypothetical protein
MDTIVLATRGSALALWQANTTASMLRAGRSDLAVEILTVKSGGDRDQTTELARFGRTGIFTAEVDEALFEKRAHVGVHSLKDVPTTLPDGLVLGGVLMRKNLAKTFDDRALPCGHTYSGHPMAVAAGLATVKAYEEEKLFPRALVLEETLRARLGKIQDRFDIVGDARGIGAFFALEFVKNKKTNEPLVPWHGAGLGVMKDLYAGLRKEGIFTFGKFNVCMVAPPLTTTDAELDQALTSLERGIEAFQKALPA